MDAITQFVASWPMLVQRGFTEHTLVVAFITVAAVGTFVMLQQEWRPNSFVTNLAFVVGGWLISVTAVVFLMAPLRKGWAMLEQAIPFLAKFSSHLYGISERHPILALAIVFVGTTSFFLKRAWPIVLAWAPLRAACTLFGIGLAIHIAGPIADMVGGEPASYFAGAKARSEKLNLPPVEAAVAHAIKSGDRRYVSVRQCVDEVSGYPSAEAGVPSPWTIGVKPLEASCHDTLGHEGAVRMNKHKAYAADYNRRMYEHNKSLARELMSKR